MKTQRGITLISVVIYVIGMSLIVGIMAVITTNFYKNVNDNIKTLNPITEYTKFNSYFTSEVNTSNIKVIECNNNINQDNPERSKLYCVW